MIQVKHQSEQGFVALISAIILMAILLVMVFAISSAGFFLRFNVLDNESKKTTLALAEACVGQAMMDLANGTASAKTVAVGSGSCKICTNPSGSNPKTILARAANKEGQSYSYSNVTAVVTQDAFNTFTINSWSEQSSYSGPSCPVP